MKKKDFCTLWPDCNYGMVCAQHDEDYHTHQVSRWVADVDLLKGVYAAGHPVIAVVMFVGVRSFGWIFW